MPDTISQPSDNDRRWLKQAEQHILLRLRERYGPVSLTRTDEDLVLAQRLLAEQCLDSTNTLELQCLGVLLGNVLAARTSMQWTRVQNDYGDLLALHSAALGFTLYPITMISKRMEDGREVDIPTLYQSILVDLGLKR